MPHALSTVAGGVEAHFLSALGLTCSHFWKDLQEDFQRGFSLLVALALGLNKSAFLNLTRVLARFATTMYVYCGAAH